MEVQTRVLVDGRWTTTNLDIQEILARNSRARQKMNKVSSEVKPPVVGLWTQTLVRSPVIVSIIPARVRHRSKNDVVFIYEDRVAIKEIIGGERIEEDPFSDISLDHVIVKDDFDSPIKAAKVLGLQRKPKTSRFPGKYWSATADRSLSPPETKPEPFHDNEIPPQIMVLSVASRMLVFLFAYHDVFGRVHFLSNTWPLPAQVSAMEELGVHLAVDPKYVFFLFILRYNSDAARSRAMAVGACENKIVLYALKSMDEMRQEVQTSGRMDAHRFIPIRKEKHADVDGIILKMEFLHPSRGDDHHVILLVIVAKDQKTRLIRYEWDCRSDFGSLEKKPAQVLPLAEQLPLLLIPLTYGSSFALICEYEIVVYRGILTGNAVGQKCVLDYAASPQEAGRSNKSPVWTQWARPMRLSNRAGPMMDHIYLCREDGMVRFIDIREDANPMVSSNYQVGTLQANLGSAFATLDLGDESNDLLVAAGEMGDGGLWLLKPRQSLDLVGAIRNWTPLRDIASTSTAEPPKHATQRVESPSKSETRLFACSGLGPDSGAVTEIRIGTEAVKLGPDIDLSELAQEGIVDMWPLPVCSHTGIYLLVAYPTCTELILLPSLSNEEPRALSEYEGLNLDVRSIAAGSTADGFLVQVTERSINAIAQERGIPPSSSTIDCIGITNACFLTIPARTTVLLFVIRRVDGFYLHHGHFGLREGRIAFEVLGEPVPLQSEISSLAMQWIEGWIVAFVGTLAGTVQTYIDYSGSSFVSDYVYQLEGQSPVCDSLAATAFGKTSDEGSDGHLLVCGLRDGTVQSLLFNRDRSKYPALSFCQELHVGTTPVKVVSDTTREGRVVLVCDQNLYTLEYPGTPSATNPATVNKIWLTDPTSPDFQQRPTECLSQANTMLPHGCSKFGAGSLFCLSGNTLLLTDLSPSADSVIVPRHLRVNGTPTSISYSEKFKRIMVVYTMAAAQQREPSQRTVGQSAITFMRPDAHALGPNSNSQDMPNVLSAADMIRGETILGAMEWFPTDRVEKRYHMIVVCTRTQRQAGRDVAGRLLLFTAKMNEIGEVEVTLKRTMEREGPVWAVAAYGDSSLIYGCGNELILQTLDMDSKRFGSACRVGLRSAVSQMSVRGTDLHVSTVSSGHHIFRVEKDRLLPKFASTSARAGTRHLCMPESLVVTSDLECRVAGLWKPPHPRLDRTAPTVFEAVLPRSITRLCEMEKAVWQKKSQVIIGSCEDGAIYQLVILTEQQWRLLAFMQNMGMREPRICPFACPSAHERHIEPSSTKKENMHINGDILLRIIERGGRSLLAEMLHKTPDPDPDKRYADYAMAEDRSQRFRELVKAVFPEATADDWGLVLGWIRSLLQPAL
ncbi:MAG: hypothetical protein LQ352_005316 [Teloschistes flavicans]|nr:MAG: hypothetical protein LQ352_005316 [Teloschistes flavicans]